MKILISQINSIQTKNIRENKKQVFAWIKWYNYHLQMNKNAHFLYPRAAALA